MDEDHIEIQENKNEQEEKGELREAGIPDEDAMNWMKTLYDIGLDFQEIEEVMIRLNDTYAKTILQKFIEEEMVIIENEFKIRFGKELTAEQREKLLHLTLERLKKISLTDLKRGIRFEMEK